jgi:hypothetical protein
MYPFPGNVFLKRWDEGSPSQLMVAMMSEKRFDGSCTCSQPHSLNVGYMALSVEPLEIALKELIVVVLCFAL